MLLINKFILLSQGGEIPYDGFPDEEPHSTSIVLLIIYNIAATAGIGFAVFCFIFNIAFRNKKLVSTNCHLFISVKYRAIKLSSPNLNYLIILGATILYICVFFYSYSSSNATIQTIFCNVSHYYNYF